MIHFFIGTKAQFIKMAPVMVELRNRGIKFRYIDSGQHAELTGMMRKNFGIPEPDVHLKKGGDITTITAAVLWTIKLIILCLRGKKWLSKNIFPGGGICLIHGDTMSTLLGMKMAKAARLQVGHVEAGLRSFCIWHPFPEELIRIYCMKRCDILFAPSDEAFDNLRNMNVRGQVFKVDGNTVVDALRLSEKAPTTVGIPDEPFALATCHRLETIAHRKRLQRIIELINRLSDQMKVIFIMHKPTGKYLRRFDLLDRISTKISVLDMQDYMDFISLVRAAKMVLTDGGSIQEECAYLNKPCLILRKKTERPDGLGKNAILWNFDDSVLNEFVEKSESLPPADLSGYPRPSAEIIDTLLKQKDN